MMKKKDRQTVRQKQKQASKFTDFIFEKNDVFFLKFVNFIIKKFDGY